PRSCSRGRHRSPCTHQAFRLTAGAPSAELHGTPRTRSKRDFSWGPSVDWWQAEFGQELLEGRDGMQIVEGRVRRYIDGLVGVPVIAGFQVLKCLLRVSQTRIRFS